MNESTLYRLPSLDEGPRLTDLLDELGIDPAGTSGNPNDIWTALGTWLVPVEPVAEMEVFDGDWVANVPKLPDGRYAIVKIGEADDE